MNAWQWAVHTVGHQPAVKRALRPVVHAVEDLVDGPLLAANARLRGMHAGQRAFIVLTGASLNDIDLRVLKGEITLGCSHLHNPWYDERFTTHPLAKRGILQWSERVGQPKRVDLTYYLGFDRMLAWLEAPHRIRHYVEHYQSVVEAFPNATFFLDTADSHLIRKYGLFDGRSVHFIKSKRPMLESAQQSHDLAQRITFRDGSVFALLAIAFHLGFGEIYLCGAGYTYEPLRVFHFYDEPVFRAGQPLTERQAVQDAVFADSGATIAGIRIDGDLERPIWVKHEPVALQHRIAADYARTLGIRIFNIVPAGASSPVYDPISWPEVVERLRRERGA